MVSLLISYDAIVGHVDYMGRTLLHWAMLCDADTKRTNKLNAMGVSLTLCDCTVLVVRFHLQLESDSSRQNGAFLAFQTVFNTSSE